MRYILTINPGSTSTKIALFEGRELFSEKTIRHSIEEISKFENIIDQFEFRKDAIMQALTESGISTSDLLFVVGRGGLLRPIPSGVYEVNEQMVEDLSLAKYGEHASNLGAIISAAIVKELDGVRAFIADPVVVDELADIAKVGGHPLFPRSSIFHALNQKAIAKQYAKEVNKKYEDLNLIVVHLGGGVSVGAHKNGRVVDVNNALAGDGPFSPERSGKIDGFSLVEACFSGKYTKKELKKMISGLGGIVAHLGTNAFQEAMTMVNNGDEKAKLIVDAFIYNVGKEVGAMAVTLEGKVDAILLTGGIAYNKQEMDILTEMIAFLAPVKVYPGEDELRALAYAGLEVFEGNSEVNQY